MGVVSLVHTDSTLLGQERLRGRSRLEVSLLERGLKVLSPRPFF